MLKGYGRFVHTFLCLNGGGTKAMNKEKLRETRKQMFAQMEQRLQEMHPKEEDRMFYYHSSEINPCIIAIPCQGILNLGDDTASVPEG